MNETELSALISRHLAGELAPDELASLENRLRDDPEAGRELARQARWEVTVRRQLDVAAKSATLLDSLAGRSQYDPAGETTDAPLIASLPSPDATQPTWARRLLGGVVGSGMVAVLVMLWLALPHRVAPVGKVIAGELVCRGNLLRAVEQAEVVGAALLEAHGRDASILELRSGTHLTFHPGARGAVVEEDRSRDLFALRLDHGTVGVRVPAIARQFSVYTSVGRVEASGGEFQVALQSQNTGESSMSYRKLLMVAVVAGVVQVDVDGRLLPVRTGERVVFGNEDKPKGRERMVLGELTKVEGQQLTISSKGDSGIKSLTVTLGKDATIRLETTQDVTTKGEGGKDRTVPKVVDGTVADLKAGQRIVVSLGEQDLVSRVLVRRVDPPKKTGEKEGDGRKSRLLNGVVSKVEGGRVTILVKTEAGSKELSFMLGNATKFEKQSDENETQKGEGGKDRTVAKVVVGSAADLVAGRRIEAVIGEGDVALKVLIPRPASPKPAKPDGKEGNGKSDKKKP